MSITIKWKNVQFVTRMKQNSINLNLKDALIVGWIKQILLFLIDVTLPYRNSKYFYREQNPK
ncbi:MAG: hypothetical protein QOK60_08100 [Nitrososphaeraceae archaeon]|nr:hypothetical protein [Nitrososphaeraceae archaeon]MDW0135135.1 hypothetical protein [Nitrososphaeraceae archaeon]MDW0146711.1 hypothetical protein [Nitrososphaeraceae archaeon]